MEIEHKPPRRFINRMHPTARFPHRSVLLLLLLGMMLYILHAGAGGGF